MNVGDRPRLPPGDALPIAERLFGVTGAGDELESERDRNLRITGADGTSYVLKVAHPEERRAVLDLQNRALLHLAAGTEPALFPEVVPSRTGDLVSTITIDDRAHFVRLVTYLPGRPIADLDDRPDELLADVGARLGAMDRDLAVFSHPEMHRFFKWDSKHAFGTIRERLADVERGERRVLLARLVDAIEARLMEQLPDLAMSVVHNDANDHNVLVDEHGRVSGIIDFGDMVHSYTVCEVANAIAYLMLGADDPLHVAAATAQGYHAARPLSGAEIRTLMDFVALRLCLSVSIAARQRKQDPDHAYLGVTEAPAWALLDSWSEEILGGPSPLPGLDSRTIVPRRTPDELLHARARVLSHTLSVSYREPLEIVRGTGAYLFAEDGRRYLDCVNNVCHVGHCHPRVVEAGRRQMAVLNTNTRYLHDTIVAYAERLAAIMPDPLGVCFFVNSGSEANDLALRLARAHTAAEDMIVIDQAYHGHTGSLIDVSPYKHDGPGGTGAPPTTHAISLPDRYRGPHRYDDPDAGPRYAAEAERVIADLRPAERPLAGVIAESIGGVAGQMEWPPGYLAHLYEHVRDAGGACIADEVQVGFGRVGTHRWGFETQDVVPDIVTLGKPIGNGHPLAAVLTTPAVAASFETGMEYFNTFGGNPVSCAIGLAVLDVIESEGLQAHAREVGTFLIDQLRDLAERHGLIGDVRGRGLFIGVELVRDRETLEPATEEAAEIVERAKDRGVLLSTDGRFSNVIKIKPPMVFSHADAATLVSTLDEVLSKLQRTRRRRR